MSIKLTLQDQRKQALKSGDKDKLRIIGSILAEIKQKEIDGQQELDDDHIFGVLDKMLKQRQDSISQYEAAGRADLVKQEQFEMDIVKTFLPAQLTENEIAIIIDRAITEVNPQGARDMGKVINIIRPQVMGRADMRSISESVKQKLEGL